MPTLLAGTLDRVLANVLLGRARRRWPLLSLVPGRWLRPLLLPSARHLRRSLAPIVLWLSLAAVAVTVLVELHP